MGDHWHRTLRPLAVTLFFAWGFATVLVDSLIPKLKGLFALNYFEAMLTQFCFFIAYFLFSLPMSALLGRIGYGPAVAVGLAIMAIGCLLFSPAATFEGADVGYRWFAARHLEPLFPFGFGLSFTDFAYKRLHLQGGDTLTAEFDVESTGSQRGIDTPQGYAEIAAHGAPPVRRLVGWSRMAVAPGETRHVSITADPRLLAAFDQNDHAWKIAGGKIRIVLGHDAAALRSPAMSSSAPAQSRHSEAPCLFQETPSVAHCCACS